MKALPVRPQPMPGEPLENYIERLAEANDWTAHGLAQYIKRAGPDHVETLMALAGCKLEQVPGPALNGPSTDLTASAAALFEQYGAAISAPRREAIAGFYHFAGATRIIDGRRTDLSRAQLDSVYRYRWTPPAYFAWEGLRFDSLGPGQVLVTGEFAYQPLGEADTGRYLYTGIVQASDSGLGIRFEAETTRPLQ